MIGVADGEAVDLLAKSWTATRILLLESGLAIVGAGVCKKAEYMWFLTWFGIFVAQERPLLR